MPAGDPSWLPRRDVLTEQEFVRLITIAVRDLGVEQVRFTGGEPLLHQGLERIIAATTRLRTRDGQVPETALTTNGVFLTERAQALRAAGLRRVNVSLDSLDRARFARLTGRDRLPQVLAGLEAATQAGLDPVKVNAVLVRGVNDDEAVPLLRWCLQHGYQLRFIEHMPLGSGEAWDRRRMVTAEEILALLRSSFRLVPADLGVRGAAPARTWSVPDQPGRPGKDPLVGIVASVSQSFCGTCDRTRLTADGQLRSCLFAQTETDLRSLLRSGATDSEIAEAWRAAMWCKPSGHGIADGTFSVPNRPMSAIGG